METSYLQYKEKYLSLKGGTCKSLKPLTVFHLRFGQNDEFLRNEATQREFISTQANVIYRTINFPEEESQLVTEIKGLCDVSQVLIYGRLFDNESVDNRLVQELNKVRSSIIQYSDQPLEEDLQRERKIILETVAVIKKDFQALSEMKMRLEMEKQQLQTESDIQRFLSFVDQLREKGNAYNNQKRISQGVIDTHKQKVLKLKKFRTAKELERKLYSDYNENLARTRNTEIVKKLNIFLQKFAEHPYKNVSLILQSSELEFPLLVKQESSSFHKVVTCFISGNWTSTVFDTLISDRSNIHNGYSFRLVSNTTETTSLEKTWWYKWITSIPICARGRLLQSTGTCWFNATFNSLILVSEIRKLMVENARNFLDLELSERNFDNGRYSLQQLLHTVIQKIYIENIRAKSTDGNFVGVLAARVKGLSEHGDEKYYLRRSSISYGDSFNSKAAIQYVLDTYFEPSITTVLNLIDEKLDEYNRKVVKYNKTKDKKLLDEINSLELERATTEAETKKIYSAINSGSSNQVLETPLEIKKILVICNSIFIGFEPLITTKKFPKDLTINNQKYQLVSSTISINNNHAICGFICSGIPYIYDSNNILTQDDWTQSIMTNYRSVYNSTGDEVFNSSEINYLIYVAI